jgi:hypothetical protein
MILQKSIFVELIMLAASNGKILSTENQFYHQIIGLEM